MFEIELVRCCGLLAEPRTLLSTAMSINLAQRLPRARGAGAP